MAQRMTKEWLKKRCKELDLYSTPALNDKLYLNFQGFSQIENLDAYTGLKSIFLEGNCLDTLQGLESCTQLKCLFVQQNNIAEISHLETLTELSHLNLSSNRLSSLTNLDKLPVLDTLLAANNRLATVESVQHLAQCPSISVLDMQRNKIDDVAVLEVLKAMPNLSCLYLQGNPVVNKIRNYRKNLIAALPNLKYLDDRPVFENDRRCAEAFVSGGVEAERAERLKIRQEEDERQRRNFEYMKKVREEGWRKRRIAMGLDPNKKGDPAFDEMDSDSELDNSDVEIPEEPEELVAARQKLAAFSAREGEEEPRELTEERHRLAKAGAAIIDAAWKKDEDTRAPAQQDAEEQAAPAPAPAPVAAERLKDYAGEESRAAKAPAGKENSTPNRPAPAPAVAPAAANGDDFDLMIKGQQVVEVVYQGGDSSDDGEDNGGSGSEVEFSSHPLESHAIEIDFDAMD